MAKRFSISDYEPVTPVAPRGELTAVNFRVAGRSLPRPPSPIAPPDEAQVRTEVADVQAGKHNQGHGEVWSGKRGHSLSFAGVFLFTFLVYFRPYELFPSLAWLSKGALIVALLTLAIFIPTQWGREKKLSGNKNRKRQKRDDQGTLGK